MKTVMNKWNRKEYEVLEIKEGKVKLRRKDGSVFTIQEKEYHANYLEKGVDKVN